MVHRRAEYDFIFLDRCKQASSAARLQGFCCCKGNVSHAVHIHHFSSAVLTSILRCKHNNDGPSYNFLYDFCSQYGLKCGEPLSVIFCTPADFLRSPPTAETSSAMAQSSGRTWHKPKLLFQLIPEDQINSNLCLDTANTSHGPQPSSTAPGSRRALCVISLKGRSEQSVYGATWILQISPLWHREAGSWGYVAKPAWNSSSTLQKYLCPHMLQKKLYIPPGMSDPKSLKAMAIGDVCLAKSEKEQSTNLATIPSRETGEGIWCLWCPQCRIQLSQKHPVAIGQGIVVLN